MSPNLDLNFVKTRERLEKSVDDEDKHSWPALDEYSEFASRLKRNTGSLVLSVPRLVTSDSGQRLRSKSLTAQINEALCRVLCHNICVVIQSVHELGIEPTFLTEAA